MEIRIRELSATVDELKQIISDLLDHYYNDREIPTERLNEIESRLDYYDDDISSASSEE